MGYLNIYVNTIFLLINDLSGALSFSEVQNSHCTSIKTKLKATTSWYLENNGWYRCESIPSSGGSSFIGRFGNFHNILQRCVGSHHYIFCYMTSLYIILQVKPDSIYIGLWIHSENVAYYDISWQCVVLWRHKLTWNKMEGAIHIWNHCKQIWRFY